MVRKKVFNRAELTYNTNGMNGTSVFCFAAAMLTQLIFIPFALQVRIANLKKYLVVHIASRSACQQILLTH